MPLAGTPRDLYMQLLARSSLQSVVALATGSPSSKYVVYATDCTYKELCGKITDRKKIA